MILIGLKLRIEKFWACRISKEFTRTEFRVLDIHPAKDYSRGILSAIGENDPKKIRDFLSSTEEVTRAEILIDEPDVKLLSFYFTHGPLGDIIIKSGVHIRPPLDLTEGTIKVNLIGSSANITQFLRETEELSDISIEIIRKSELKFIGNPRLTNKQENILKVAVRFGYYDIPRRITVAELAEKLNLSPSTVTEHIRKAENKIIKDYI